MNLECAYKDINYCHTKFIQADDCVCDTSLIVPDTKSDIVKVVSVSAYPYVSDTKCEGGRITISGQVKFCVLYIGEDENSRISNLTSTVPFSHVVTHDNTPLIPLSFIRCHNAEYTLINSRKIKVSSLLKLCIATFETSSMKVLTKADGAQCKSKETEFFSPATICRKNIPVTSTVDIPGVQKEIKNILRSSAEVSDFDYKVLSNKAIVKGNIMFTCLFSTDDGISTSTVSVPFTEVVEAEGLTQNRETNITLTVSDCDCVSDTDLSGEYKMLDISLLLTATIISFNKERINAVNDLFLPRGNIKTESCTIPVQSCITPAFEDEFIKESITLNSAEPTFEKILDVNISVLEVSQSENIATAVLEVSVLYLSPNSDFSLNSHSAKISVSHKSGFVNPKNLTAQVKNAGYVISGENNLELRINISFCAYTATEEDITLFTSCEEAEYTPKSRPSVIVSFVNKNDTLWDIAKKYNIPVASLASANAIDENASLAVGSKLIIPR